MKTQDIAIILIICFWLMSLITSFFLYLKFKDKYKKLRIFSINSKKNLETTIKNFKLVPVTIEFELPEDETCYYFNNNQGLLKTNNKKLKEISKNIYKTKLYITNKTVLFILENIYFKYNIEYVDNFFIDQAYINKQWFRLITMIIQKTKYTLIDETNIIYLTLKNVIKEKNKNE
ncbi:hypothetical protein SLITO_v1c05190 [Spiroplasma litorale]|uniref:Uncharacterized protein n=1 Tax=Spiroplasma litorale TaxID=216942 RepID=A0A0K1W241_9MOLU|nr:hypothetical protein [Spiroplasma litorale]AKX34167.1 hypothetical protein SLITO_v1c05190 [Spiroplasma litorale]